MKKFKFFFLFLTFLVFPCMSTLAVPALLSFNSGVTLSDQQWQAILSQFEDSVFSLSQWLEKSQKDKRKLQNDIKALEDKTISLRQKGEDGSNVFDEIRLKNLLNDLKEKLEMNANLQHEWDYKQKEFEQKALSLTALYNERIETELGNTDSSSETTKLDIKLSDLTTLVQKRNRIQELLSEYQKRTDNDGLLSVSSFDSFKTNDTESLQMTLDLFQDRKKDLEEQLEKWTLEEDEAKNELKLQGKMKEFLEDIQQINEDSDMPHGDIKHNGLVGLVGKNQKNKLGVRLTELQEKIDIGEKALSQIGLLITKVQHQLHSSNGGKKQ